MDQPVLKVNLHTHTNRCRHASGTIQDYCREAQKAGIKILGFSDHGPFPDYEYHPERMYYSELPDYVREIEEAQAEFPDLILLKGLEMDYRPYLGKSFYEEEYFGRFGLDYLIGGQHYIPPSAANTAIHVDYISPLPISFMKKFAEASVVTMETGLIDYFNHPDLMAMSCDRWTPDHRAAMKDILDAAIDLDIPLEINAYGFRKPYIDTPDGRRPQYPWRPFWEMAAETKVKVVIGMDAHKPEDVHSNYAEVKAFADELGFVPCNDEVAEKILARKKMKSR